MGGSRRRLKKHKTKVRVGVIKKKANQKADLPLEITQQRTSITERLNTKVDWNTEQTLVANYKKSGFVLDPNQAFGRNKQSFPLKSKEDREEAGEDTFSDDDELRVVCHQERKTGKAPPPRLTSTQRKIVSQLLEAYGDNVHAMVLDRKLNPMQHAEGKLRALIEGYHHWRADAKHDFRGPNKPYKRL